MKKISLVFLFLMLHLTTTAAVFADLNQFAGRWTNINPNPGGISVLEISLAGAAITVQAWEKSNSNVIDWGKTTAYAYAPSGSSNLANSARVISALFKDKAKQSLIIIRPQGTYRLQVEEFTRFLNEAGRVNYHSFHNFSRNM